MSARLNRLFAADGPADAFPLRARSSSSASPTRCCGCGPPYVDELAHGRDGMSQPFHCATPEEALATHRVFTAALRSEAERSVVSLS